MAKIPKRLDHALDTFKADWRKSGNKLFLTKALALCRARHLRVPTWLHQSVYQIGLELIINRKKRGRRTDLLSDDVRYATVEIYLEMGLTQEEAFARTAREYLPDAEGDRSGTIKSTWLRHSKRITPWIHGGGLEWGFKKEYIENDKNSAMAECPGYLKIK